MWNELKCTGGYASILAGTLLIIGHGLNLRGGVEFGTVAGSTCVFAAHLLLTFAFIAMYSFKTKGSIVGLIGMIMGVIGTIASTAVVYVEISGASGNSVRAVNASGVPYIIHTVLPTLFVVGLILVGISIVRGNVLPRLGGYLLIVGTIVFVAASFTGNQQAVIEVLGSLITGVGFIRVGVPLITRTTSN